jgi:poly(beta-D-mannuronate) lyase
MRTPSTKPLVALLLILLSWTARGKDVLLADASAVRQALKKTQPGDTLIMRDGTWHDAKIILDVHGTASKPITLRAQTPGGVILSGASSIRIGGDFIVVQGLLFRDGAMPGGQVIIFRSESSHEAHNCRVTDCAIIDYNPASQGTNSYWVSMYGLSNRLDHCYFHGKNDESPLLTVWVGSEPNYHLIDHNSFFKRPPLGRNGGETVRIGTSQVSMLNSRAVLEYNYFEDCSGEAEYISNKSCENIYRYNTFVECQGALVLRHGNRCTVSGNWFFGKNREGTGGIRVIGEDHRIYNNYLCQLGGTNFESAMPFVNGIPNSKPNEYFQIKRATVAFNTLVDCRQSITFGVGIGFRNRTQPAMDCTIANNIVVSSNAPLIRLQDKPLNTTWTGNIVFGADPGLENPGILKVDPLLRLGAPGIYRPGSGSPALAGASGDFAFVTEDIEGKPRLGKKDIGCFQASPGGAVHHPLNPQETGVPWLHQKN